MPLTELHIKAPNKHKMGPDAKGGTADTTGAKGIANKKQRPVTKGARPLGECNFEHFWSLELGTIGVYPPKKNPRFLFTVNGDPTPAVSPPVLAPSATPAVLSAKVATVETPKMEPKSAAMASAK